MASYEDTISPPKRIITINWKELYQYRDLFWVLAWRDFAVRYKQTALGMLWAIFRPLISMLVFTFVFSKGMGVKGDPNTPYPIFVSIGQLFWLFFSETLTGASNSMVANSAMIQKIYFPRLILPATTILTGFVDFAIASVVLAGLMFYFKFTPNWTGLILVPVLLIISCLTTLGVGMFFASLNVKYRDVKHALPFIIQMMMFISPIIYPVTMFDKYPVAKELLFWVNPMSGVITNARAAILGNTPLELHALLVASIMSVVYFIFGLYYFRQTERYFADIV